MTGLRDWIACPTLWLLRRDTPPPTTMRAAELVRRIAVGEMVGVPPVDQPDIRWSTEIPYLHAATACGRLVARTVSDSLDHRGAHLAGYHDAELSAIETVGAGDDPTLCWWLVDVGQRPAPEAWLRVAEIATERVAATDGGVVEVRLRRWPTEPVVTVHEPRLLAPIAAQLEIADSAARGLAASDPQRWPRTPGLHCRRCPDQVCPVRSAYGSGSGSGG